MTWTDTGNKRIQVFDGDWQFQIRVLHMLVPQLPASVRHQYLYVSNSNPVDSMDNGEIYKLELKFGGKQMKQFGTVNQIYCRHPNELLVF